MIRIKNILIFGLFVFIIPGHSIDLFKYQLKKIPKKDRIELAVKQEFESTVDPSSGIVPTNRLYEIYQELVRNPLLESREGQALNWEERGPVNVAGRTRSVLIHKGDPSGNTLLAGSVSGGVWKTYNAKASVPQWYHTSGMMDNLAISCLVQDPDNNNIIYAGTGEGYFNVDALKGNGIWKSVDAGNNWTRLASTSGAEFEYTLDIAINSSGHIFACTRNNGVMRSTNGGINWEKVLGKYQFAGTDRAVNIIISTDGTLLCSMGLFETDGIYRSYDNGTSWEKLSGGLPQSGFQRIELAGTPGNDQLYYALFEEAQTGECLGIFKSTDQGDNWAAVSLPDAYGMSNFTRTQAWYNLVIAIDPDNENRVIVGGIDLHMTENGGSSWVQLSQWAGLAGYDYVHADQHAIIFEGNGTGDVYFGNDGGVARCQDINAYDPVISHINTGFNVTQFYGAAIHPDGTVPVILAGAQDNGTQKFSGPGQNITEEVTGGDGSFCHVDQLDPQIMITSYVFNNYFVSTDGGLNFTLKSFNNSGRFVNPSAYDSQTKKLYASNWAGSYFRWNNPAQGGSSRDFVSVSEFQNAVVTAVSLSPNVADRAYFGLDDGRVVMVDDISQGITKTGTTIFPGQAGSVSSIAISKGNEDHLLVSFSNYGVQSLWHSLNAGNSWVAVEGNLPDFPVRWGIFHPDGDDKAMIATELGIWRTDLLDGQNTVWYNESNPLSYVRIDMLVVRPEDHYLVAATHGRGLFSSQSLVGAKVNFTSTAMTLSEAANSGDSGLCQLDNQTISIPVNISVLPSQTINITVSVGAGTTATSSEDFQLLTTNLSFTPTGPLEKNINLQLLDEAVLEPAETLVLKLNGAPEYLGSNSELTITILDDDMDPASPGSQSFQLGQVSGSVYDFPFGGYYEDGKTQILYKQEELLAAGMMAGSINALAFEVLQKNSDSPFQNFNISLKHVNLSQLGNAGSGFIPEGTPVFSGVVNTFVGWNELTFDQPFNWNGQDDLLVTVCFNNQNWSDDDHVSTSMTSFVSVGYMGADGTNGCAFSYYGEVSNQRPVIKLLASPSVVLADGLCSKNSTIIQGEQAHFYSAGKLIASIVNLDGGDISCMQIELDRIGTDIIYPGWAQGKGISQKTFFIDAMYNAPYELSLYYQPGELAAWPDPLGLHMIKTETPISQCDGSGIQILDNNEIEVNVLPDGIIVYKGVFSDFSGFGLTDMESSTLALDLLAFNVESHDEYNHLSWLSELVPAGATLEIERAFEDEAGFNPIYEAEKLSNYGEFKDFELQSGNTYYRLRQIDQEGQFSYSEVRVIRRSEDIQAAQEAVRLNPNPARDWIRLETVEKAMEFTAFRLISLSGEDLTKMVEFIKSNGTTRIGIHDLDPGLYALQWQNVNGETGVLKFVKW